MPVIITILLLLIAFNGILCQPLGREEQLRRIFENNYLKYLKDIVYFPDSTHLIEESSTPKSYTTLNKPHFKSIRNPLLKKHHVYPTAQNVGVETTSDSILKCQTSNTKECEEYRKIVYDVFNKENHYNDRIQDNHSNKIYINNNIDSTNSWAYEEERNPAINDYPKALNENFIISGTELTGDYETTTDDLSFRIPPAPIVAALLG